jgi:DNA-binding MarR family transcriptional regulator
VRRLARTLGTDAMNVQRIARTPIAVGLCVATQDPADARRRPLHPTAEGKRLAKVVAHRAATTEENLSVVLGPQRYATVVNPLQRLLPHDDPASSRMGIPLWSRSA